MFRHVRNIRTPSKGFSLVEMIVYIVVAGIVVGAVTPIFRGSARSFYTVTAMNENLQSARIGFNRMMADLKEINRSQSISSGTSNGITFVNTDAATISYAQSGTAVNRTKTGIPLAVMIPNVGGFTVQYYDSSRALISPPLAAPANVWSIQVTLDVTAAGQTARFQQTVNPRNFPFR